MVSVSSRKMRNLFLFMGFAMVFLVAVVFLFNPNKTFSEYTVVVGDERYIVNLSSELYNMPENISAIYNDTSNSYYAEFLVSYADENGEKFDFSNFDSSPLSYDCGLDVCHIYYEDIYTDVFDEKIGSIRFYFERDISDYEGLLPISFTYEGKEYNLDYYYLTFGDYVSLDYAKISNIKLNGNDVPSKRYVFDSDGNHHIVYFSDKIDFTDESDDVSFKWEYYVNKFKITNKVDGEGADLNKTFNFGISSVLDLPDGVYGDFIVEKDFINVSLKNGESAYFELPGNCEFYGYLDRDEYITSFSSNSNIALDFYNEYYFSFIPVVESDGEIIYSNVFTAAKPLTITNNVTGVDNPNKEFGFTITLGDSSINGVYSGVKFTNGVGRIHLKNGESKSILFPASETSYRISATSYSDYNYISPSNYSGNISSVNEIVADYEYVFSPEGFENLDGLYSATVVSAEEMIPGRSYVAFRATGGVGYLLTGKGNAKKLNSYCDGRGCKVTWPDSGDAYANVLWKYNGTLDNALFESFGAVNTYLTVGKSTSGKNPVGNEISYVKLETSSSPAMKVSNDGYYLALTSDKKKFTSSTSGSSLYFAEIDEGIYTVEFNGSNDGLHIYDGAVDKDYKVIDGDTIIAPNVDNVKSPLKYDYKLDSWVELTTGKKVKPGEELTVNGNYKFYANWVPKSYDIGVNKDVVSNLDTSSFIKTEVFDYSELYNLYSTNYVNNRWSLLGNGNPVYFNSSVSPIVSRGVVFFDNTKNSKNGLLNSVDNRDSYNSSKQVNNGKDFYDGTITKGISSYVISDLFNKNGNIHGVNYVGSDKYLYQYDETSGYYYYDSTKNAASYNKSDERFYVYDYTYGTSKSYKDGENKSDFLPFNYMTKKDAEAGKSISASNGSTNYWFGLKSEISFDLIDDVGVMLSNGEYGNKDINGNDMILKFSGDDDVWVFVDDKLVLDLGGAHDIVYGEINFSTGVVTVAQNGASINYDAAFGFGFNGEEISDSTKIQQTQLTGVGAGAHKVTFYYVERGASQSNVSLYFNICKGYRDPGDIIITRHEDSYASLEKHEFTIALSDNSINGYYGEADFTSGIAMFRLAGGESLTISGLPAGLNYTVSVKAPVEHTTQFTSNGKVYATRIVSGRVVGGNISQVEYINNYSEYSSDSEDEVIPDTFDSTIIYIILLGVSLFIISGVFFFKKHDKNNNKNNNSNNDVEIL